MNQIIKLSSLANFSSVLTNSYNNETDAQFDITAADNLDFPCNGLDSLSVFSGSPVSSHPPSRPGLPLPPTPPAHRQSHASRSNISSQHQDSGLYEVEVDTRNPHPAAASAASRQNEDDNMYLLTHEDIEKLTIGPGPSVSAASKAAEDDPYSLATGVPPDFGVYVQPDNPIQDIRTADLQDVSHVHITTTKKVIHAPSIKSGESIRERFQRQRQSLRRRNSDSSHHPPALNLSASQFSNLTGSVRDSRQPVRYRASISPETYQPLLKDETRKGPSCMDPILMATFDKGGVSNLAYPHPSESYITQQRRSNSIGESNRLLSIPGQRISQIPTTGVSVSLGCKTPKELSMILRGSSVSNNTKVEFIKPIIDKFREGGVYHLFKLLEACPKLLMYNDPVTGDRLTFLEFLPAMLFMKSLKTEFIVNQTRIAVKQVCGSEFVYCVFNKIRHEVAQYKFANPKNKVRADLFWNEIKKAFDEEIPGFQDLRRLKKWTLKEAVEKLHVAQTQIRSKSHKSHKSHKRGPSLFGCGGSRRH